MDSSVLYKLAYELHYTDQNFGEALKVYKKIVNEYPNSPEAEYAKTQIISIENLAEKKSQMSNIKNREQEQNFRSERGSNKPQSHDTEQTMIHKTQTQGYLNQPGFVPNPQTQYESTQQRLKMNTKQTTDYSNHGQRQAVPEQGSKIQTTPEDYNWTQIQNKKPDHLTNKPTNEPRYVNPLDYQEANKNNIGDNDQARRASVEARLRSENHPQEQPINQAGFTNIPKNTSPTNPSNVTNGNTESQASFKTIQNFKTFFEDKNGTVSNQTNIPSNNQQSIMNHNMMQPEVSRPVENNSPQTINNTIGQNSAHNWTQPRIELPQGTIPTKTSAKDSEIAEKETAAVSANNNEYSNQQAQTITRNSEISPLPNQTKPTMETIPSHGNTNIPDLVSIQENIDILSRDIKTHQKGLAIVFSAIIPGLGQIYTGMLKQGIIWVAGWLVALIVLFSLSFVEGPTGIVFKGLGIRQLILIVVMFLFWAFNLRQISQGIKR